LLGAVVTSHLCQNRKWPSLFNHLVGAHDDRRRHCYAKSARTLLLIAISKRVGCSNGGVLDIRMRGA
jgi:hypothetical protein